MNRFFLLLMTLCLMALISCGKKSPLSGNSVNTGNTISGSVTDGNGNNLTNVTVLLYPYRYDPVKDSLITLDTVFTDENGKFVFEDLESSRYNLQLSAENSSAKATVNNVALLPEENLELDPVMLLETGKIFLSLNDKEFQAGGYIYIPGSNVYTPVESEDIQQGVLVLQELPATDYTDIIYVSPQLETSVNLISDTLALQPNQEEVLVPNINQNVLKGVVKNEAGSLVANAVVALYPRGYDPILDSIISIRTTFSNSGGIFEFEDVSPGQYNLVFSSLNTDEKALVPNITILKDDTLHVGLIPIKRTARVTLSLGISDFKTNDYIYIPGMGVVTLISDSDFLEGNITLDLLPPGTYDKIYHVNPTTSDINNLLNEILILSPDETGLIGLYNEWNYSMGWVVNTTATGLNVNQDVFNYPLLLRLEFSNFNFSQANSDGSDIRFLKSDMLTEFPFEIENWDPVNQSALIWVKIDTVFGNDSTQFFHMYWGNDQGSLQSNSKNVFPTSEGYEAVWHLSNIDITDEPLTFDASGDNHGTIAGDLRNLSKSTSLIYRGFQFNGVNQHIISSRPDSAVNTFTYSFWMKTDSAGGVLMGFNNNTGHIDRHVYMGNDGLLHFGVFPDTNLTDSLIEEGVRRIVSTTNSYADNNWHFITASLSSQGQKLFVDGVLRDHDPTTTYGGNFYTASWKVGRTSQANWEGRSTQEYFLGEMDEVRIWKAMKSEAWIKLSYETQRPDFKGYGIK